MPVVFVGACATLIGNFPYNALHPSAASIIGEDLPALARLVATASNGIVALCLVVLISHYIAVETQERRKIEISPPLAATVALVNFFIFVHLSGDPTDAWALGPRSVLAAILIAIGSTEVFIHCLRVRFLDFGGKTYDLDPGLHLAVRAISPAFVTVAVFLLLSLALLALPHDLSLLVSKLVLTLNGAADSQLPGLLVLGLLNQLLWFFGIHGPHVLMQSVFPAMQALLVDGWPAFDFPETFFSLYVNIGGSGSTLGLLLAILVVRQGTESRRLAKYALVPSLFNINELIIFGLPIIFNPVYLIPFLLAPLLQIALGYVCVRYGFVTLDVTPVPWMTPPLLAGTINANHWHGGLLQLFGILTSALIYFPFVRLAEGQRKAESSRHVHRVVADIENFRLQNRRILDRQDEVGHTARKLLHEFMQDLGSDRVYLAYQPQHDRQGKIVGVEALLRWHHRHFGMISPGVICALAEESQQINAVGRWAIDAACRQMHAWKSLDIAALRVSVNLSPLQLSDPGLVGWVAQCLRENQLVAADFGLELTESQYVPDDPVSCQTLHDLHALGIHLEMDDFGMGYSSMLYIRRFHFDSIKLDGSLTRDVLQNSNCIDIIKSVVQLGRALGMRIIAEFVETQEQRILLESLGCDTFQGYLFSPALTGADCIAYLRNGMDAVVADPEFPLAPAATSA